MNRARRESVRRVFSQIEAILEQLDDVIIDEGDALERTPENLRGSRGFQTREREYGALEAASEKLMEAQDELENCM